MRRRSPRRRRRIMHSSRPRSTDIDQFLVYGGTAIGDALQTAVLLGRQVTDLAPTDDDGVTAPASSQATRTLAQASSCGDEQEPRIDPLPLRRRADERTAPATRGSAAREGGVLPRLHDRARNARRRHRAWPVRGHPGLTGFPGHSGASGSRNATCDREDDRRGVLGGAYRRVADEGLREPGLAAGPRDGQERDHVAVRGDRGRAAAARDRDRRVRLAAPALIRPPRP